MKRILRKLVAPYEKLRLRSKEFVIVSNNCWGFDSYKTLGREYNTPFVGLYLYPGDYLKLLGNFPRLGDEVLSFRNESAHVEGSPGYPVGVVFDSVEIHFLHYKDEDEARSKWTRRIERMRQGIDGGAKLLFKMCDRDGCTSGQLEHFHRLPIVKKHQGISFGVNEVDHPHHVKVGGELAEGEVQVIDGLKLFEKRYKVFDYPDWVIDGTIQSSVIAGILGAGQ